MEGYVRGRFVSGLRPDGGRVKMGGIATHFGSEINISKI